MKKTYELPDLEHLDTYPDGVDHADRAPRKPVTDSAEEPLRDVTPHLRPYEDPNWLMLSLRHVTP